MRLSTQLARLAITGGVVLVTVGCVPRYEWHEIQPINTLESHSVNRNGTEVKEQNEGQKKTDKAESETISGVWLYRLVRNNFTRGEPGNLHQLRAIEVMFCPSREMDISTCRLGVVWREDRHPMGRIVDIR